MVWQGGAIDVSAAEAAAGALAEAAAGSVLEANGEELVVARLRGLPWSFDAVKVRRRTLTQRWEPLGGGLAAHCVGVSERGIAWAFCAGMPPAGRRKQDAVGRGLLGRGRAQRPCLPAHTAHRACQVCDFVAAVGVTAQPEAVTMLHNAAGEAFITLESKSQETEVLKANRQQVGKRYVEVFSSSAAEKQAGSPPPEPLPEPEPEPEPEP